MRTILRPRSIAPRLGDYSSTWNWSVQQTLPTINNDSTSPVGGSGSWARCPEPRQDDSQVADIDVVIPVQVAVADRCGWCDTAEIRQQERQVI